jgi:predicted transcriptional regulator
MKRCRNDIISHILSICLNGANKTRIVYQANLNFRTVNPYMDILIKNNLIEASQGGLVLYRTTQKGASLLETMNQVSKELSGNGRNEV